ncbi:hypothetical protein ES707_22656 [subsurface metagenome]
MKTKLCTKCGEEKSLEEFHRCKSNKDGRYSNCKICKNAKNKARRADPDYRERENAKNREYQSNPDYRERENAKQRVRYANDPDYRERENAKNKAHRADPDYRERENANRRAHRADLDYRERENANRRAQRHRKKGEKTAFMLMKAADILKNKFKKGNDDGKRTK